MSVFYRYIRPTKLNDTRIELDTLPKGGVCLRFEEYQGKDEAWIWFTYSRCRNNELFSKDVAKLIADARATAAVDRKHHLLGHYGKLEYVKGADEMIGRVVQWCDTWVPPPEATPMIQHYHRVAMQELSTTIKLLLAQNERERKKAEIWKAGIAAAGYSARYEELNK